MNANFEGHADEILSSMHKAAITALEEVGIQAEGYAKKIAPVAEYHGGDLRQSISHKVDARAQEVYIGTNVEYGVYQELGTGEYYEGEGGRHTAWCYEDKKGNKHWTRGNKAHPFLRPAVQDHKQTYKNIIEDTLKGK